MTRIQRNAVRKRISLERAVRELRARFDALQKVRPKVGEYTRLIVGEALGNRDAARQLTLIRRAKRRYERQREEVNVLIIETERAIAQALIFAK